MIDPSPSQETKHPFYYLKDHLGSTRAVIDVAGNVTESSDYYPFGLQMPGRGFLFGNIATKEGFTGKEQDGETGWHYHGARFRNAALGMWLSADPLADEYPSQSPYNYALNNPVVYYDPDGREVVFSDSSEAADAANALNEVNSGANISVEAVVEEHSFLGLFSWTTTTYKLSTNGSNFDWSQNKYTMALYDVINSKEIILNVKFVPGDTGWPITIDEGGGGRADSYEGGSDISISNTIRKNKKNASNEPLGVVLMHEIVSHGHPVGGKNAHDINDYYEKKLGYKRLKDNRIKHLGYHVIIGWKKTGLYNSKKEKK